MQALVAVALNHIVTRPCWENSPNGWRLAIEKTILNARPALVAARSLAQLPFLCASATGCPPENAVPAAAAWLQAYIAARIFDAIEDGHFDPQDWGNQSAAQTLNVAAALLAAIPLLLDEINDLPLRTALNRDFHQALLQTAAGQHLDLEGESALDRDPLQRYWEIAAAKSGIPIGLACRIGAALGDPTPEILDAFTEFGQKVGRLAQACDDYQDFYQPRTPIDFHSTRPALPLIYARSVAGPAELEHLATLQIQAQTDPAPLYQFLDHIGARHYLALNLFLMNQEATAILTRTGIQGPNYEALHALIPSLPES